MFCGLFEIPKNRGSFINRLTTLEGCDKIYSLDNGMIKMEGSYKEVFDDRHIDN